MAWLLKRKGPSGPTGIVVPTGSATAGTLVGGRWSYVYDDERSAARRMAVQLRVTNRLTVRSEPVTAVEAP